MTTSLFLTLDELHTLTGFAVKTKQIEQLRRMGLPFFVNGCGRPVVAVSVVEGIKHGAKPQQGWKPAVLHGNRKAA